MLDLDQVDVEVDCPDCGFYSTVRFKQIRLEDVTICGGCKRNIQLVDFMSSLEKARREIAHALEQMRDELSGTISIEL